MPANATLVIAGDVELAEVDRPDGRESPAQSVLEVQRASQREVRACREDLAFLHLDLRAGETEVEPRGGRSTPKWSTAIDDYRGLAAHL